VRGVVVEGRLLGLLRRGVSAFGPVLDLEELLREVPNINLELRLVGLLVGFVERHVRGQLGLGDVLLELGSLLIYILNPHLSFFLLVNEGEQLREALTTALHLGGPQVVELLHLAHYSSGLALHGGQVSVQHLLWGVAQREQEVPLLKWIYTSVPGRLTLLLEGDPNGHLAGVFLVGQFRYMDIVTVSLDGAASVSAGRASGTAGDLGNTD